MSFTDFPVTDKTLEGILRDLYLRSDQQARRGLPERLQTVGRLVADWNDAREVGFYASDAAALNSPDSAKRWVGQVFADSTGALIQEVRSSSVASTTADFLQTYRRRWSGSAWSSWLLLTSDSGWQALSVASGWTSTSALSYRLRSNEVQFKGEFYGGADATTVFTLPTGFRPVTRLGAYVGRPVTSSNPPWGNLSIATSGVATFSILGGTIPASSPGFSMAQVSFPVD